MKVGFLATLVTTFSLAGTVLAQPLASGHPFRKAEPTLPVDCVQLGRPRPLREVSKAAAPLTACSHVQPTSHTNVNPCVLGPDGNQRALAPSDGSHRTPAPFCWEDFCIDESVVCGPEGRIWASAEYLLWWFEGNRVPPLVTTSPPASAGIIGAPGTTVLFGSRDLEQEAHSGGRFTLGFWLNECQTIGLEAGYLFLGSRATEFTASGTGLPGSPVVARPIVNGLTGAETAQVVSFPGAVAGNIHFVSSSRLEGAGVSGLANLCCDCRYRVDFLTGFRYLELREGIGDRESVAVSPAVPTIGGSTLAVADQFDTRNQFYGGQLGARAEYRWRKVFLVTTASVALGTNREEIDIHGSTVITPAGGPRTTLAGGILALPSNSGHFSRDRFAVVPEIGVNLGYQVTPHLRAFVGYGFLYISNVARPGNLIDRTVNLSQIPSNLGPGILVGPARPALVLKDTEFWAQGINFGLEIRY